jgi:hypothetical protein
MAPPDIAELMVRAVVVTVKVPPRAVHDATAIGAADALVKEARAAGHLGGDVRTLERAAREDAVRMRQFEAAERALAENLRTGRTLASAIAQGNALDGLDLPDILAAVSTRDRLTLATLAAHFMEGRSAREAVFLENNMAGAVREVVARELPVVQAVIDPIVMDARLATVGSATASVIDSARYGPEAAYSAVHMATVLRDGERTVQLGTDRIIGLVNAGRGSAEGLRLAGSIDIVVAVEVKGRTVVLDGLAQLRALPDRAVQRYCIIGGNLWLIRYDPAKVHHILVAPPGPLFAGAVAEAERLTAAGFRVEVVEIPVHLDDQIKAFARHALRLAATPG